MGRGPRADDPGGPHRLCVRRRVPQSRLLRRPLLPHHCHRADRTARGQAGQGESAYRQAAGCGSQASGDGRARASTGFRRAGAVQDDRQADAADYECPGKRLLMFAQLKRGYQVARDAAGWRPSNLRLLTYPYVDRERNRRSGLIDQDHLLAAAEWIERAQDATGDGGVSGRYSLRRGWTSSYPETTGYLVPTLIHLSDTLREPRYRERARRAIDFLLSVQLPSGAFPGMEIAANRTEPSIFNSAQIVCGLRAWHSDSKDPRALDAMRRACDWLVAQQDPDGAWRRFIYGNVAYTYMAHAACWIAEAGAYL